MADPLADKIEAQEYGIQISSLQELFDLDGLILAVSYRVYLEMPKEQLFDYLRLGGVLIDVKSVFNPVTLPSNIHY